MYWVFLSTLLYLFFTCYHPSSLHYGSMQLELQYEYKWSPIVALSSSLYSWANCSDGICGLQEDFRIAQGLWELYFTISSTYYPSTDSSDRIAEDCNSILDCNGIWKICSDLLALHKWKVLERGSVRMTWWVPSLHCIKIMCMNLSNW